MSNIVSICGSLRKGSYNRMVMNLLPGLAPAGMAIKEAPSFAEFPLYSADIQNASGFPATVNPSRIPSAPQMASSSVRRNTTSPSRARSRMPSTGYHACRTSPLPASRSRSNRLPLAPSAVGASNRTCAA
jgi:hypothetical protein